MTIFSNDSIRRLFTAVIASGPLPSDLRDELERWDSAAERDAPGLDRWATDLAGRIEVRCPAQPGVIYPAKDRSRASSNPAPSL